MAIVTFTKVSNRVTVSNDGIIYGLRGAMNVFPHPNKEAIIVTQHVDPVVVLNGHGDGLIFNVSDVATPSAADKNALVTALQSVFS